MKTLLLTYLKPLLGGGSSYIFLGLGVMLLFQHWQLGNIRDNQAALEVARDEAVSLAKEREILIASQNRQFQRQIATRKEQDNAQDQIKAVPDSHDCSRSAPVIRALEWVREHEASHAETDSD